MEEFVYSKYTLFISGLVDLQTSYQPVSAPLKGLGAGLCLSQIYARQFGGDVRLESSGLGRGVTCTILIPTSPDILEVDVSLNDDE